jgi:hypothetical protein
MPLLMRRAGDSSAAAELEFPAPLACDPVARRGGLQITSAVLCSE